LAQIGIQRWRKLIKNSSSQNLLIFIKPGIMTHECTLVHEQITIIGRLRVQYAGRWFSPVTPVSFTNKTDRHDITEILLKVALNTITLTP
jgi:hypothetical protein